MVRRTPRPTRTDTLFAFTTRFRTRSTASCICSLICAMLSSGTAGSPRRSSATSLCELRMACSPPFTATYMASVLRQDAARQADDGLAAGQEDVDPERELRGVESRSEEHTSELQSLMRTSYAVFCLKKKKN